MLLQSESADNRFFLVARRTAMTMLTLAMRVHVCVHVCIATVAADVMCRSKQTARFRQAAAERRRAMSSDERDDAR